MLERLSAAALTVVTLFAVAESATQTIPSVRRVIVVVCDGLTWRDVEQMDEPMPTLLRKSAIGLLSGASLDLQGKRGVYATLGSGMRRGANSRSPLKEWLQRHGKRVWVYGNGDLELMLGTRNHGRAVSKSDPNGMTDVSFVAVPRQRLLPALKRLAADLPSNACLWLIVPNSPQTGWATRRLTPIFLFGKSVPNGLLTSPTTRTLGLVSSVDFAPSLLSQLSVPIPPNMTGSVMRIVTDGMQDRGSRTRVAYLRWLDERSAQPLKDLLALATVIVAVIAIALALFTLHFLPLALPRSLAPLFTFIVVAGMSIPAMLFVAAQLPHRSGWTNGLQLLFAATLIGIAAMQAGVTLAPHFAPSNQHSFTATGIVCGLSAVIALFGVPLYWATPLGHYPTTGWRYFGITNSGVGIVLAGTVFAWHLLGLPDRLMLTWCVAAPMLMGFSFWGVNLGGAMTLAFCFAFAWEWLVKPKPSWRRCVVRAVIALLATAIGLTLVESFLPADQKAHLGQLLQRMEVLGMMALMEMLVRKLSLLWSFTTALPFNFALLATFAAFTISVPLLAKRFWVFAKLLPSFVAVFVGAWAGFFLNDSGMEVIGMALVYTGGIVLLGLAHARKGVGMNVLRPCR